MNEEKIKDKISDYFIDKDSNDPGILEIEKQISEINNKIELMLPPDQYSQYNKNIAEQEKLRFERDNLLFVKIYKEAFKDGLLTGLELNI
jgi:hypothetical protein